MFSFPQSYVQMPWQFPNYTDTLKTPQVAQQLMKCMCISVCNQISTNIKPIVMQETIIKSCRELNIYICVCFSTAYSQSCILIFNFCQHTFRQTALTSHCIHNYYAVTEHLFKWYCLHKALCYDCSWNEWKYLMISKNLNCQYMPIRLYYTVGLLSQWSLQTLLCKLLYCTIDRKLFLYYTSMIWQGTHHSKRILYW